MGRIFVFPFRRWMAGLILCGLVWAGLSSSAQMAAPGPNLAGGTPSAGADPATSSLYLPVILKDHCGAPYWACDYKKKKGLYVGGVVADYLAIRDWNIYWKTLNPLAVMKQNGIDWLRVGVTTRSDTYLAATPPSQWSSLPWRDSYWGSREYAGQIMKEAAALGYHLNLFFFLSDRPADAGRQNAPPEWANLSLQDTAVQLQNYTFATTQYYLNQGLQIELYDIGNEIEWGILNFRPDERIPLPPGVDKTTDMDYMRTQVWDKEAYLLKSAIAGVKQANPAARIVLHINSLMYNYNDDVHARAFFQAMVDQQVPFDFAGLSYPYASGVWIPNNYSRAQFYERLQKTIDYLAGLQKPVIISEASYHHQTYMTECMGPFGPEPCPIVPMPDYPLTPSGQAAWVRDQLRYASNHPNVAGFFYFYPDWFPRAGVPGTEALQTAGLFASDTQVLPALQEFRVNLP